MRRLIAAGLVLVTLSGCAARSGFVSHEWATNMRELGIHPIFPPRENLRVGDVFIIEGNASGNSNKPEVDTLGVFFDNLKLDSELNAFYSGRPDFTVPVADKASLISFSSRPAAEPIRLHRVAFPGFLRATASGAEIAALVPAQGVPIGFSSMLSSTRTASLSVSGAESYSLPLAHIISKIGSEEKFLESVRGKVRASALRAPSFVDVVIINELYFARSFNVTLYEDAAAAASLKASLIDAAADSSMLPQGNIVDEIGDGSSAGEAAAQSKGPSAGAQRTADAIATEAKARLGRARAQSTLAIPTTNGGSLSIGRNAMGSVTLNQEYDVPIAIGYRGIRRRLQITVGSDGSEQLVVSTSPTLVPLSGTVPMSAK